jgi:thymidylate synthase
MHKSFKYSEFETLDDLLNSTYKHILDNGNLISGKRGGIKEVLNFAITLTNCRSRTSRSLDRRLVKSKFAEFAWYLSGDADRDYIKPYISAYNNEESENNKILGGYGPKIFNSDGNKISQFERIYQQINERESTKQAYLAISNQSDYKVRTDKFSSPPCTIGLHFIVRNGSLNLTTYMRSNDAYFGLPHDLFCFTMLQEVMSCKTSIPLGSYTHVCTSMHIYERHFERVKNYLDEGFPEGIFMPPMKNLDKMSLQVIVDSFGNAKNSVDRSNLDLYWSDYCLFANRFTKEVSEEKWLSLFQTKEFKDIADCSITE